MGEGSERSGQSERFLARDLMVTVPGIPISMSCGEAVAILLAQPHLPCLAVVGSDNEPLGLVERERLLSTFSDSLRSELYRRRPIEKFLHDVFLVVDENTHIDEISDLIAGRYPNALASGFIVTSGGHYAGIGTGIRLLSMVVTLTRQRSTDFQAASARAETANLAKSTFLAAMSHEIRTPLNSVIGNLELLEDADGVQERRELVAAALSAAQTLLQILGDVLDFSKIESDHTQLESLPIDPAEIVREVATQLASKAGHRGIALTVHVGDGVPALILGDQIRLRQIVLNMTGNALKFTAEGRIAVSVTRVWDPIAPPSLRFEVADTGAGFAPDRGAGLFEAFTQEDITITRRFGGTGLGLAIARKLVGAMGGSIGADGLPGGGATFWFEIPVVAETAPERGAAMTGVAGARVALIGFGDGGQAIRDVLLTRGVEADTVSQIDASTVGHLASYAAAVLDVSGLTDAFPATAAIQAAAGCRGAGGRLVLTYPITNPGWARIAYRHGFDLAVARPCPPTEICHAIAVVLGASAVVPRDAGRKEEVGRVVTLAGRGGGDPLLVIDDMVMNQEVVRRQLRRLGLSCEVASDGAQGLAMATNRRYAAILVDGWMPVMDGYEFTRRFRTWESGSSQRTPVIAMTAHAMTEDIGKSLEAGMDYHLIKPVALDHLAVALDHWLAGPVQSPPPETPCQQPAPMPTVPAPDPVDLPGLSAILGETEPGEVREVLEIFVAQAATLLARLEVAVADQDREALGAAAHAAKGAARNAAAVALIPIVSEIEAVADTADWPVLRASTAAVTTALNKIRSFVEHI